MTVLLGDNVKKFSQHLLDDNMNYKNPVSLCLRLILILPLEDSFSLIWQHLMDFWASQVAQW